MVAAALFRHLLIKHAASAFGGFAKDIVPAFKAEAAPASAGIMRVPNAGVQAVKPELMNDVVRPIGPGGNPMPPRISSASQPALEAKSVFRGQTTMPPTQRIVKNPQTVAYYAQHAPPQVSSDIDDMKMQEQELAGQVRDPNMDPSSRVLMQNRMKKLYDQIQTGPALDLTNPAGHAAALAARAQKIQQHRSALLSQLYRDAEAPIKPAQAATTQQIAPTPFY